MSEIAIEINGLQKRYGYFQLGPLDLDVPSGAIYAILGPNGAGKTTTFDLIMGMGRKDAGSIRVFGLDHLQDEVAVKAQTGYASPDLNFAGWGRVKKCLSFFRGFFPDWDDAYCLSLLDRFQVGWDDRISTLSFGGRIKLGLVLALSHRPKLLLLDEPLAGLDAISKRQVFEELLEAVQDEERTVVISSHNLDDIERFADHVAILKDGRLLLHGPTSELLERYRIVDTPVVAPSHFEGLWLVRRGSPSGSAQGVLDPQAQHQRYLVDTTSEAFSFLSQAAGDDVRETPVTLEELFVAAVEGKTPAAAERARRAQGQAERAQT